MLLYASIIIFFLVNGNEYAIILPFSTIFLIYWQLALKKQLIAILYFEQNVIVYISTQ